MNVLNNVKSWVGNYQPKTYRDALDAWGAVARKGFPPADKADILHQVNLVGGSRLMAVRAIGPDGNPKVLAILSMD